MNGCYDGFTGRNAYESKVLPNDQNGARIMRQYQQGQKNKTFCTKINNQKYSQCRDKTDLTMTNKYGRLSYDPKKVISDPFSIKFNDTQVLRTNLLRKQRISNLQTRLTKDNTSFCHTDNENLFLETILGSSNQKSNLEDILGQKIDVEQTKQKSQRQSKTLNLFKITQTKRYNEFSSKMNKQNHNPLEGSLNKTTKHVSPQHHGSKDKFVKNMNHLQNNMSVKSYCKQAFMNKTEVQKEDKKNRATVGKLKNYLSTQNSFHSKADKPNASVQLGKCRSRMQSKINHDNSFIKSNTYFTPKSYLQIRKDVLLSKIIDPHIQDSVNDNNIKQLNVNRTVESECEQIYPKQMKTLKTQASLAKSSVYPLGFNLDKIIKDQKKRAEETSKYIGMNFTRYNINQFKSLHKAIFQYSQGDLKLLKRSLVIVLNLSGILIEEDSLDRMNIELESLGTLKNKLQSKKIITKNTSSFHKRTATIKLSQSHKNNWEPTKTKQFLTTIKSFKSIANNEGLNRSTKKNIGINVRRILEQNLKKIHNFDSFLQLFKIIEGHYFKQSIIDYLETILGSVIMKKHEEKRRKLRNRTDNKTKKKQQINVGMHEDEEQESDDSQLQSDYVLISDHEIFEAFRKRYNEQETVQITNLMFEKLKQKRSEHIRQIYPAFTNKKRHSSRSSSFLQKQLASTQMSVLKIEIKQVKQNTCKENWRIDLKQIYNLCYEDNEICQALHQYYVKQVNFGRLRQQLNTKRSNK